MPFLPLLLLALAPAPAPLQAQPAAASPPAAAAFAGLWDTSYGRMRLLQAGPEVHGTYDYAGGAEIRGTLAGTRLEFAYREPGAAGVGWFELSADGGSFAGRWRREGSEAWLPWSGQRLDPVPGRMWLVVLEAYWEQSLAEEPYSFGAMLQSYFTMASARHVEVRHRFFHDAADLRRLCAEVRYLAEPAVLLISTHGSPEGIAAGGATIDAAAIADCVRAAAPLQLLHLSGCSMMSGAVPARVLAELPPAARCPISGYRTSVAWDASALADFLYLSLIFMHGQTPADAVRQCHVLAPYTGHAPPPGGAFDALGLDILVPDATGQP